MPKPLSIHCAHDRLVPTASLQPNPRNPNQHPPEQMRRYRKIITHQGIRRAIVVSNQSGHIVTGHGLYLLLLEMGVPEAPVNFQNFATPADEFAHLLADNKLAEDSAIDDALLKDILIELDTADFDLDLAGFDGDSKKVLNEVNAVQDPGPLAEKFQVVVDCKNEAAQAKLYQRLTKEGHECQLLTL